MNNFDVIGVFSGIIGVIFAVVFVESIYIRIIISLSILVILLIIKIILLHKDDKILAENLADAKKNNKALAQQYRAKNNELNNTVKQNEKILRYWLWLNSAFQNAIQGSKRDRFEEAYKIYRDYTNDLTDNNFKEE